MKIWMSPTFPARNATHHRFTILNRTCCPSTRFPDEPLLRLRACTMTSCSLLSLSARMKPNRLSENHRTTTPACNRAYSHWEYTVKCLAMKQGKTKIKTPGKQPTDQPATQKQTHETNKQTPDTSRKVQHIYQEIFVELNCEAWWGDQEVLITGGVTLQCSEANTKPRET